VDVFGTGCVRVLMRAAMEQHDLVPRLDELTHDWRAEIPRAAQHQDETHRRLNIWLEPEDAPSGESTFATRPDAGWLLCSTPLDGVA
jgi:hypothetical protein